jgi:hypothetical protein
VLIFKGTNPTQNPTASTQVNSEPLAVRLRKATTLENRAAIIEENLVSTRDKKVMFDLDIRVIDILKGMFTKPEERDIHPMLARWNADLGETYFKF